MAAAKRKAPKKKTAKKASRTRKPVVSTAPLKKATTTPAAAPGNASTPIHAHPYANLPFSTRRDLDTANHGFNHLHILPPPLLVLPSRRRTTKTLEPHPALITPLMNLMQNKLFLLREHFLPEVKALMFHGTERARPWKKTPSEMALLEEFAKGGATTRGGGAGLAVSPRAQDCVRLILCFAALFAKEDMEAREMDEEVAKEEREGDLWYRGVVWGWLKEEIGEQLPWGSKEVREGRAEVVMRQVFKLEGEEEGSEVVEVGKSGNA